MAGGPAMDRDYDEGGFPDEPAPRAAAVTSGRAAPAAPRRALREDLDDDIPF
jgi:hypothetical protein